MRPSSRDKILEAACRLVERQGVTAVTFEAVAGESGISRGGLLYHFATRDELIVALHAHLAEKWEGLMIDALGVPLEDAGDLDRVRAYARVSSNSASRADLLLMLEASAHPELRRIWSSVSERWLPAHAVNVSDDEAALDRVIAVLAADGLWVSDSVGELKIPPSLRTALAERIASMLGAPSRA